MLTNDVKKGWQVKFENGMICTVHDNRKGNLRMVQPIEGQGLFTDIGDDYAVRWRQARPNADAPWQPIELTEAQKKFKVQLRAGGW